MSRPEAVPPRESSWPITNPWPLLIGGLVSVLLAFFLKVWGLSSDLGVLLRVVFLVGGLIAAGGAVSLRLQSAAWDVDSRYRSAGILALAALAALIGFAALDPAWDSFRLLLGVVVGVALGGALLVLVPQTVRRVWISLLVLYHFGGILTAATSVAPPSGMPPWITLQIWTRLYRPYLQFMYLNNAYHFYSPEPGPPILLWFRVEYDGVVEESPGKFVPDARWIKIPNRNDFRTQLEYQRRLAMTESTNNLVSQPPANFDYLWHRRLFGDNDQNIQPELRGHPDQIGKKMSMGENIYLIPPFPNLVIHPTLQYREPTPYSKKLISSYARHVARNYPSEVDPSRKVLGVKVYRVVHWMLTAGEFAQKIHPNDETNYRTYYQGEFDRDGKLLNASDPFLYWAIPILMMRKDGGSPFDEKGVRAKPEDLVVIDYVRIHANTPKPPSKPK